MGGTSNPSDSWLSGEPAPSSFYPLPHQDRPLHPPAPASGFQELIDRAPQAMAVCDRELRYLAVNRRWKKDFGLEDRNLVGQRHSDLFPYLGVHWDRALRSVLLGHPEECPRDQWVQPSHRPAWVRWHLEPWSSKRETIGGFTITCEILDTEAPDPLTQIGRSLFHSPFNPFVRLDFEGRIIEWNAAARAWAFTAVAREPQPYFWDAFCPDQHRDGVRLHFLHDARETVAQRSFCFAPLWSRAFHSPEPDQFEAAWAAHPYVDAQNQILGVLFFGLALPNAAPPGAPPAAPALPPFAGSSLAQLVEFAPFGLVLLDPEGRTVFANHEHASLLGLDLRSHPNIEDWLRSACPSPQDAEKLIDTWKQSVWQEEGTRTFLLRSSNHHLCRIRFHPRRTGDGGLLLALSDVTEYYQKLEHIEDEEGRFRSLFHHAQVGLALEDVAGRIVYANAAFSKLTHQNPDTLLQRSFLDLVHPEDRPSVHARISEIRHHAPSESPSLDVRLLPGPPSPASPQDTGEIFVRLTLCGIPETGRDALLLACFLTDIAIERLKPGRASHSSPEDSARLSSLRRHSMAFEQAGEAILITDPSGRILEWNPAASRLFGYPRQAILGKSFSILFSPSQPHRFHHSVAAAFAESGSWTGTQAFFRQDGSEGLCELHYVAVPELSGGSTLIIGFHRPAGPTDAEYSAAGS